MEAEWNGQFALDGHDEVGKSRRRAAVERVKVRRHVGQHFELVTSGRSVEISEALLGQPSAA